MQKEMRDTRGFTLVELSIGLVIIGLLTGAILGGVQMIGNAKVRRTVKDLQGLNSAVYTFYDKMQRLPGDANSDGSFDKDASVWTDLEAEQLGNRVKKSPFGVAYVFDFADATKAKTTNREGNLISVSIPADVAKSIDTQMDDGVYNKGVITAAKDYSGKAPVTMNYFLD
jgi:prepilin-type N-terminal cleavage/methylation domain-containing protein